MKIRRHTEESPRPVPKGIRFGKTLGLLMGLALAAIVAAPGFLWVNSMWDNDLRETAAEWGQPMQAAITDRGPLMTQYRGDYEWQVRTVVVRPSGAAPASVWMTEADSNLDTTTVWRSSQTGELYVSGDFDHLTSGVSYDTPIRIGDHTLAMFLIGLCTLVVFIVSVAFGAGAAEDYKYRDVRLRARTQE